MMDQSTINEMAGIEGIFAECVGAEFGLWAGILTSTCGGYLAGELIQQPAYIIQALLREEVFVERQLIVDSVSSPNIVVDGSVNDRPLLSSANDYYNGSYVINNTQSTRKTVSDYIGASKTLTLNSTAGFGAGDIISLINVQGNSKIDNTSFNLVGNNTDGLRNGWLFAKSIIDKTSVSQIINQLLYESHCILFQSYNQYKLVALDSVSSADAWTKCLKTEGREFFDIRLTSLINIFTSFKLNYFYNYGKQNYEKSFYVDKNSYTSGGTVISTTEKTLCESAETNYRIKNNFEYSSDWIYDLTTAEYLLQKLVNWFTKQRMIVTWTTPLSDGSIDYIKYELGDQVVLTNSRILPTGISGVKCFMIMSKTMAMVPGAPFITWTLFEMEDLST